MQLLKIGDRVLNVDLVTEYTVEDTTVIVRFVGGAEARFTRQDGALLRQWLEQEALDLAQDSQPKQETWIDHALPPRRGRDPRR